MSPSPFPKASEVLKICQGLSLAHSKSPTVEADNVSRQEYEVLWETTRTSTLGTLDNWQGSLLDHIDQAFLSCFTNDGVTVTPTFLTASKDYRNRFIRYRTRVVQLSTDDTVARSSAGLPYPEYLAARVNFHLHPVTESNIITPLLTKSFLRWTQDALDKCPAAITEVRLNLHSLLLNIATTIGMIIWLACPLSLNNGECQN